MAEYLVRVPGELAPNDSGSLLSFACAGLGGLAWLAAALIAWVPYLFSDLAGIVAGTRGPRPGLVVAFLVTLMSASVLAAAGLVLGWRGRRRVRRGGGPMRGAWIALLGTSASGLLLVVLSALVLFTVQVAADEYANAIRCAQSDTCIVP